MFILLPSIFGVGGEGDGVGAGEHAEGRGFITAVPRFFFGLDFFFFSPSEES